ncbi:hypothetical protein P3X46_013426 [Hevea brasiliensis]|uniref:mitogen-activated protein kinase kinase kinase n=1 Tax=Hevea brasiliensis TaxID=3981 RepID=A0ABQ9M3N5_HEVBR|nr:E3 ubiquitin-protein ligase UPL5-like [Hevea brasiliensis]KAJ9174821.1 hypothetical protein P3X46_013426 [Hevea brasiliensis]
MNKHFVLRRVDPEQMANGESNCIRLSIKIPDGTTEEFLVYPGSTVKDVHEGILLACKIPVTEQKLYCKGKQLQRWQTLEDCSIQNDDCLELQRGFDDKSVLLQKIHQMSSKICRMCQGQSLPKETLQDDPKTIVALLALLTEEESENLMSSYSVPATLVMLYRSAIPQHKAYASALIRFSMEKISNCPNVSVDRCIHLASEFCASLSTVYGDPLYQPWRTTLKQLLERGNLSELRTIFQIRTSFFEMANTLSILLSKMQESNRNSYPIKLIESLKFHFCEFQVFSCVLRNAICGIDNAKEKDKSIVDLLSTGIKGVFSYLLNKMENNLRLIPETARIFETSGWLHSVSIVYLDILKELNSISQLWENEQKQFQHVLMNQQISLQLILEKTTRKDDYHWLLEHNDVIDSKSRMHLVTMMMIPEEKLLDAEFYKPLIHWSRFLDEELYESLKNNNITSPKKLQDWLYKLCQAIFKPQNLLFLACSNDPMKFYPNPELKLEPLHFDCFEFSGKVIALALMHEVQVGVAFHRLFLLPLAGEEISVKDLRDANPSFYNNKAKHRFHDDDEILDDFINSMSEQISFFRKGFDSVFGKSIDELLKYRGIDVEDLNLVLKGDLNLGFNSGERTHVNHDNNESDPLMSQFLKINRQRLNITKSKWLKDRKKPLGGGIFGQVYKGYADGGFFFAVKEIQIKNKGEIDKINQEVNLLCQFSHPNIVKYYGTEEDESKVNIFLELVSTGSLRKVYRSFELEESQVSHYTKQILEGLKYLHERKVVHGDIKCANILVDEKGHVKITDFGLTKVYGKIDWTAPEVMKQDKEYGFEADIWSLGCTVVEMLIRDFPYSHLKELRKELRAKSTEPLKDFKEDLELKVEEGSIVEYLPEYSLRDYPLALDFIERCLKRNPNERPTADTLLEHKFVKDKFVKDSGC